MALTNSLVSIIIPVYNVSAYIERCIKSVMNQTYIDIECIIVDDATPDDSIVKCEKMITSYDGPIQFTILHHQLNRGISAARNTGTNAATGEYIYYLDSDDEITSDCIEKLVEPILCDDTIEMVMGNYDLYSDDFPILSSMKHHDVMLKQEIKTNGEIRNLFFRGKGYYNNAWNKIIKRSFVNQNKLFFKEDILWEDTLWTFFVMKYLSHIFFVPDITYHYCLRPHSITKGSNHDVLLHNYGKIYLEISNNFTKGESDVEAKFYLNKLLSYLFQSPEDPNYIESARLFKKVFVERKCTREYLLLSAIFLFSKLRVGKWMYKVKHHLFNFNRK